MEVHVLFAVNDERERVRRRDLAHRAAHRVPHRDHGEDRWRELSVRVGGNRVVGGGGVLLDPLRLDLEVLLVRPLSNLFDGELHQYSSGSPASPRGSLPSPSRWPSVSTFVRAVGRASRRSGAIGLPDTSSTPYVPLSMRSSAACSSASSPSSCSRIETSFSRSNVSVAVSAGCWS